MKLQKSGVKPGHPLRWFYLQFVDYNNDKDNALHCLYNDELYLS